MHTLHVGCLRGDGTFVTGYRYFSSPNWTELNSQVVGTPRTSLLEEKFSFLPNELTTLYQTLLFIIINLTSKRIGLLDIQGI
jgi:hypothetical protein